MDKQCNSGYEKMILSVIIPAYNNSKYIKESVLSVLNQPCKELNVVIINDGSTDGTLDIANGIAAMDKRVTVVSQENSGVSGARNKGIELCIHKKSKYIAFLDSDDVWADNYYTDAMFNKLVNDDVTLYRFGYYECCEDLSRGALRATEDVAFYENIPLHGGSFCSYIYKLDVFEKYNLRFPDNIKHNEDGTLMYIYSLLADSLVSSSKVSFLYRGNPTSVTRKKKNTTEVFVNNIFPAWDWAKKEIKRIEKMANIPEERVLVAIRGCDEMKKAMLGEFIRVSCVSGKEIKEIKSNINCEELSRLYADDSLWIDDLNLKSWNDFKKKPRRMWVKHRIKGIVESIIHSWLRNTEQFKKRRYPEYMSGIYSEKVQKGM